MKFYIRLYSGVTRCAQYMCSVLNESLIVHVYYVTVSVTVRYTPRSHYMREPDWAVLTRLILRPL